MDITYLGHSSFKLKGRSASLVTDPFDAKMLGLKFSGVEADIVTISHDHSDHNKASAVSGVKKTISGPGEYEVMGISVLGFASYHDDKEGTLRGNNTIFVIEVDGLRICHLGDLGHALSEGLVEDIGDIDILMVPVGGEYTIALQQAVEVVQQIEPSIVIPMHYKVPGLSEATFTKLSGVSEFVKEVGLNSETLPKLSIKKEEIGEGQKVVVLEKK